MGEVIICMQTAERESIQTLPGYQGSHVRKDSWGNWRSPHCPRDNNRVNVLVHIDRKVKGQDDRRVADGAVVLLKRRDRITRFEGRAPAEVMFLKKGRTSYCGNAKKR